jgi:hypothetical protein
MLKTLFSEIFTNGIYSCVTASTLYALIVDKLSVSYSIREVPNQVYIVAASEKSNMVFETTTPCSRAPQICDKVEQVHRESRQEQGTHF